VKKKLKLPDVTLLAVTSTEMDEAQLSMRISLHNIEFAKSKLLCSSPPKQKYADIEYVPIQPLKSVDDYNELIFQNLYKYFETSRCLIVQADSFVVNASLWKEEFLKYDYIGGPWPNKIEIKPDLILNLEKNPVGNGGFSLRSRKLVETTAKINFKSLNFPMKAEDVVICHYLYQKMIDSGIRFAPPKLAAQFSMENIENLYGQNINSVFGFHGKHMRNYFLKKYRLRSVIGEW
jgi:hypothetical protein|tara:strand:+ start:3465 stop:4166 length:702 start_codon:yes stop_codon:yes gene_type:complete